MGKPAGFFLSQEMVKSMEIAAKNRPEIQSKVELLAPAGNFEAFLGAVNAGADAVYLGGEKFGARAYADNFTTDEICRAIHIAHFMGRKIYLTVNTLLKEAEIPELIPYLQPFYEAGLDGVIVQDIGVLVLIREHFPDLALHASTQMAVTGVGGSAFLGEHGVERIVPARELSLSEVRAIKEHTGLEIECFIHGAMCYCYSGQCLFSSMLGGRSGNRGRCAQPCRLPYRIYDDAGRASDLKAEYPLSLKDMCTISCLPQLIGAGIDSFKIEGRMKKAEYAAGVTALYRKYIDLYYENGAETYKVSETDLDRLRSLYIRSEIQTGYYERHNGREMITLHKPSYAGSDENVLGQIRAAYLREPDRMAVNMKVRLEKGKCAVMQILEAETGEGNTVTAVGDLVQKAQNAPLRPDEVRKRLCKTGNSCIEVRDCEISMEEDVFLPVRALNELRRAGIEEFECQCILRQGMVAERKAEITARTIPTWSVNDTPSVMDAETDILVSTYGQLAEAVRHPCRRIYIESDLYLSCYEKTAACMSAQTGRTRPEFYLALPYVLRGKDADYMERLTGRLTDIGGFLIRNYEEAAFVRGLGEDFEMVPDAGLYCFHSESVRFWAHYGKEYTLPWELNREEAENLVRRARQIGMRSAMIVYGRAPMMVTANCIRKTAGQCAGRKSGRSAQKTLFTLKDRYGTVFPVEINCMHCYNIIYNSVPFSLHHQENMVQRIRADVRRYDFTVETKEECRQILGGGPFPYETFTTGHLRRGVE